MCAKGYAQGAGSTARHSCEGKNSRLLASAGALFFLIMLTLLAVAVVFLVGGIDALEAVHRSMARSLSISSKKPDSSRHPVLETSEPETGSPAHASSAISEAEKRKDQDEPGVSAGGTTTIVGRPASCIVRSPVVSGLATSDLVVVWQILTVFPSITLVNFPFSYSRFLDLINVVNLDIGQILAAACVLPALDFYERLLVTTLTPLGLAMALVLTHQLAKRREGSARRLAWSRHMAAGLLATFLVSFVRVSACGDRFLGVPSPGEWRWL